MPNHKNATYRPKDYKDHPKFKENASAVVCWWCGQKTGDTYESGDKFSGKAPSEIILDSAPCDTCAARQAKGFTYIIVERNCAGHKGWFVTNDPPQAPGGMTPKSLAYVDSQFIIKNNVSARAIDREGAH